MVYISRRVAAILAVFSVITSTAPLAFAADRGESGGISIRYATGFTIERHGGLKILEITAPLKSWSNERAPAEVQRDKIVLRPRGSDAPVPEEFADATLIETPIRTVAVNAETDEAFLAALGVEDRLVAVGGTYSYNDDIRSKVASGELKQLGYSWHAPPNLDVAVALGADVFFLRLATLDHAPALARARGLGVKTVPVFPGTERDYLARAEWLKFYAAFFDLDAEAEALFTEVEARVQELRRQVAQRGDRRNVLLAYYAGRDRWVASVRGPNAQLLRDAGGDNPFFEEEDVQRSTIEPVSSERLMIEGRDAECWIIGDAHGVPLPHDRFMATFRAWQDGCLWSNTKRSKPDVNAFDWYEMGVVRPDRILEDLVSILHPALLQKDLDFFEPFDKDSSE